MFVQRRLFVAASIAAVSALAAHVLPHLRGALAHASGNTDSPHNLSVIDKTLIQANASANCVDDLQFPATYRVTGSVYTTCQIRYAVPAVPAGLASTFAVSGSTNWSIDNTGSSAYDWHLTQAPGGEVCSGDLPSNKITQCSVPKSFPGGLYPQGIQQELNIHNQGWVTSAQYYVLIAPFCQDGKQAGYDMCTNGSIYSAFISGLNSWVWTTGGCVVAPADPRKCGGQPYCCSNSNRVPANITSCGSNCYDCTGSC